MAKSVREILRLVFTTCEGKGWYFFLTPAWSP